MSLHFQKIKLLLIILLIQIFNTDLNIYIKEDQYKNKFILANIIIENFASLYSSSPRPKPDFSMKKIEKYPITKKNGICICVIGKNENKYAREFIDYYYSLKVDKIIIFDNNDINGESFEDVLKDFIENKFVEIIDVRGFISVQLPLYNYFYYKYQNDFDWFIYIDFDEYIEIEQNKTLYEYLYNQRFEKCQSILLNTRFYGDNDLLYYDNRPLNERFDKPLNFAMVGKCIVRTGFKNIIIPTTMTVGIGIKYFCNHKGERIFPPNYYFRKFNKDDKTFVKHFTKTSEEFCNKLKRGDACFGSNFITYKYGEILMSKINNFLSINKKTKEKVKIFNKCIKENFLNKGIPGLYLLNYTER